MSGILSSILALWLFSLRHHYGANGVPLLGLLGVVDSIVEEVIGVRNLRIYPVWIRRRWLDSFISFQHHSERVARVVRGSKFSS